MTNADERRDILVQSARTYTTCGWYLVPVLPKNKRPGWGDARPIGEWQKLRLSQDELSIGLHGDSNMGVILGEPSGWLVDIDCDCIEAVELAHLCMPPTWTFGRSSRPRSHWLYRCEGAQTTQYRGPKDESGGSGEMLVELRSTGGQTVIPPSVHPSGEEVEWSDGNDSQSQPTTIGLETMRVNVRRLACAALAAKHSTIKEAGEWILGGKCPALPPYVRLRIREWMGVAKLLRSTPVQPGSVTVGERMERARAYLRKIQGAVSGSGGHTQTFIAAQHLVHGFNLHGPEALALLLEEYNPRCSPPWSEAELEHKVTQAIAKGSTVTPGQHLRVVRS